MRDTLFTVTALDHPDSAQKRADLRPDHLRWLATNSDKFMLAGPLRDTEDGPVVGSLLVLSARDKTALQDFLATDPYAMGDLFARVHIRHFQPVTGAWLAP